MDERRLNEFVGFRVTPRMQWWLELQAQIYDTSVSQVLRRIVRQGAVLEIQKMQRYRVGGSAAQLSLWPVDLELEHLDLV